MRIEATPRRALCDEKVEIKITDAKPGREVEMTAELVYPWAANVTFRSKAAFVAGEDGAVDLAQARPLRGSYDYADSMGLIQSLQLVSGNLDDVTHMDISQELKISLEARQDDETAGCVLERFFFTPDVRRRKLAGELVGELLYAEQPGRSTVIVLGGSDGNLQALLPIASLFASHGFNALALSYFNGPGLPSKLEEVPLDFMKKALQQLQIWPETKDNPVFVQGTSKGGEMALILAALHPEIQKTVAWAPHGYCYQGLAYKNRSSWTLEGEPLPYLRVKNSWVCREMAQAFLKNASFGYMTSYRKGMEQAKNKEAARIKVEQGNSAYLLLSGTDDNIWNAHDGCRTAMDALEKAAYPHRHEHIAYEGAGHPFYPPYIIPLAINKMKIAPRITFFTGGSLEANGKAQKDMWQRTLEFLKEG